MIRLFGLDSLRRRWRWAVISRSWRRDPEYRSVMNDLKPHIGFAGDGTATGALLLKGEWRVRRFGHGVLAVVRELCSDGAREPAALVGALTAARLGLDEEAEALLLDAAFLDAQARDRAQILLAKNLEGGGSAI